MASKHASCFSTLARKLHLHVGDYYRTRGTQLPQPAFMEIQVFRFGLSDLSQHYHLPIKLTP